MKKLRPFYSPPARLRISPASQQTSHCLRSASVHFLYSQCILEAQKHLPNKAFFTCNLTDSDSFSSDVLSLTVFFSPATQTLRGVSGALGGEILLPLSPLFPHMEVNSSPPQSVRISWCFFRIETDISQWMDTYGEKRTKMSWLSKASIIIVTIIRKLIPKFYWKLSFRQALD